VVSRTSGQDIRIADNTIRESLDAVHIRLQPSRQRG
jgi:hypothetical protein